MQCCPETREGPLNLAPKKVPVPRMYSRPSSQFATLYTFLTTPAGRTLLYFFSPAHSCPPKMTHLYSNVAETARPAQQLCLISSLTLAPSQPRPPRLVASPWLRHLFFFFLSPPSFCSLFFFFLGPGVLYLKSKE